MASLTEIPPEGNEPAGPEAPSAEGGGSPGPPVAALVSLPVAHVVRVLARGHLAAVDEGVQAWKEGGEMESLHRLRVELRRMRTLFRVYRPWTGRIPRRRVVRRHLRPLVAATGRVRDLDVQLRDLGVATATRPAEHATRQWLQGRLEEERGHAVKELVKRLDKHYSPLYRALERALAGYRVGLEVASPWSGPTSLGEATSRVLPDLATELHGDVLLLSGGTSSPESLHATRILAKRLRYTLAPFAGGFPGVESLLARLEGLQDHLGGIQDARIQGERLVALLETCPEEEETADIRSRLQAMESRSRKRVLARPILPRGWRGAGLTRFLLDVQSLAARLVVAPESALPLPKEGDLPEEIERKYLLTGLPPYPRNTRRLLIDQGWIPGEQLQERLRRVRGGGSIRYFRTVKLGRGIRRVEVEEETTPEVFRRLWGLTVGRRVRKRRFILEEDGHTWEIDQFLDRELVLAEVELPSAETPVALPPWLQPLVVREVTGEDAFVNVNLAC
jgi:CHAD domain-containing protein/CYTH domain-containing protein